MFIFLEKATLTDAHYHGNETSGTLHRPGVESCYKWYRCACTRFRGKCVATTHPQSIRTVQSLNTRYSKPLKFSVCVIAELAIAPTNSSRIVYSPIASKPRTKPGKAHPPFVTGSSRVLWSVQSKRGTFQTV